MDLRQVRAATLPCSLLRELGPTLRVGALRDGALGDERPEVAHAELSGHSQNALHGRLARQAQEHVDLWNWRSSRRSGQALDECQAILRADELYLAAETLAVEEF